MEAMELAHRQFNPLVTVEAPFLTPGLDYFRPGMAAFDEKDMDMVQRGLSGTRRCSSARRSPAQNTYNCRIYNFSAPRTPTSFSAGSSRAASARR